MYFRISKNVEKMYFRISKNVEKIKKTKKRKKVLHFVEGSDIFVLSGTGSTFFTRKVYNIFKENKITNFDPKNVMDFVIVDSFEKDLRAYKFKNSEAYNW